ncbi:MAG: hypothetical protein JWP01_473 [Myxococcales bacterium]|nr:hypothetical protein [Myxococcales bacterium]
MRAHSLIAVSLLATACTTLGPMPATTGLSAVPTHRPGAEVQASVMPVFFLSDAAHEGDADAAATPQLSAILEPDRLFGSKGLILGARTWGESGDSPLEPMIGVRRRLDDTFAIAGIAYGTFARGESGGASYSATRFGGEAAIDATILPLGYLEFHAQATLAATYLDASGRYCVSSNGEATDCDQYSRLVDGELAGIYTSATAGVSLDIARRPHGVLHGIRLAAMAAVGAMPRIRNGIQSASNDHYRSFGLSLTIGLGSDD